MGMDWEVNENLTWEESDLEGPSWSSEMVGSSLCDIGLKWHDAISNCISCVECSPAMTNLSKYSIDNQLVGHKPALPTI